MAYILIEQKVLAWGSAWQPFAKITGTGYEIVNVMMMERYNGIQMGTRECLCNKSNALSRAKHSMGYKMDEENGLSITILR